MIQLERLEKVLDELVATAGEMDKAARQNCNNVPPRLRERLNEKIQACRTLLAEMRGQQRLSL
jgi:hypothetical protein